MQSEAEIRSLLALHRQTGGHPTWLNRMLAHFGTAESAVREVTRAALAELGVPADVSESVCNNRDRSVANAVDRDIGWLRRDDHYLVHLESEQYPPRLKEIHDPPPLLFCEGSTPLLGDIQLAMVGSRRMSATGRKVAHWLAGELCRAGMTITSGLARGIDAASHEGALQAGGKTIAVLGSGCDVIYPAVNRRLAGRIRESGGLIVSEFPLGTAARGYHFPRRNRIVTGMSVGTLVVEAALRSGSLISARLAMEQGREVFAVPGSVLSPMSAGCHKLIRDGAKLTESIVDIIEELSGIVEPMEATTAQSSQLTDRQHELVSLLGSEPVSMDYLTEASGTPVHEILSLLVELEIDGLVVAEPGGYVLSAGMQLRGGA